MLRDKKNQLGAYLIEEMKKIDRRQEEDRLIYLLRKEDQLTGRAEGGHIALVEIENGPLTTLPGCLISQLPLPPEGGCTCTW